MGLGIWVCVGRLHLPRKKAQSGSCTWARAAGPSCPPTSPQGNPVLLSQRTSSVGATSGQPVPRVSQSFSVRGAVTDLSIVLSAPNLFMVGGRHRGLEIPSVGSPLAGPESSPWARAQQVAHLCRGEGT